jgi:hypothetical protein
LSRHRHAEGLTVDRYGQDHLAATSTSSNNKY